MKLRDITFFVFFAHCVKFQSDIIKTFESYGTLKGLRVKKKTRNDSIGFNQAGGPVMNWPPNLSLSSLIGNACNSQKFDRQKDGWMDKSCLSSNSIGWGHKQ